MVTATRSARIARASWALLAAACVAACNGDSPPSDDAAPVGEQAPTGVVVAAPPDATTPDVESQSSPRPFDVGEIKDAAGYLEDPELAGADIERGRLLSLACAACHTFGAGERTIIGPNLHGVFGRPAASMPDFAYSPALRASGLYWTPRSLAAWLADPQGFVSGTTMTFTGYHSAQDRHDLIAYLLRATNN
jgi:cytochrome c